MPLTRRKALCALGVFLTGSILAACAPEPPPPPPPEPPPPLTTALVYSVSKWERDPVPDAALADVVRCVEERLRRAKVPAFEVSPVDGAAEVRISRLDADAGSRLEARLAARGDVVFRIVVSQSLMREERVKREMAGDLYRPPENTKWFAREDGGEDMLVQPPSGFGSKDFATTDAVQGGASAWAVRFEMKEDRAEAFAEFTGRNVQRTLAVIAGGRIVMAPVITDRLPGAGHITGPGGEDAWSEAKARRLADEWAGPPLPMKVTLTAERDL